MSSYRARCATDHPAGRRSGRDRPHLLCGRVVPAQVVTKVLIWIVTAQRPPFGLAGAVPGLVADARRRSDCWVSTAPTSTYSSPGEANGRPSGST
jgi:hypothetical protein